MVAELGWSHQRHGLQLSRSQWQTLFSKRRDHFDVVADVLDFVVSPTGNVARPKMMNTLAQALLWFHEGCRETVTLMAIVKFSASLDSLACGRKSSGIQRLIEERLGLKGDPRIRKDGPTMKAAVTDFYSEGHSRTIHGTNDKLAHDWTETRGLAEQFARYGLMACIDWVANNTSSDDPSCLSLP